MQKRDTAKLSALLGALSDPTRIRLLLALQENGEQCVIDLQKKLRARQPIVSHHLAILRAHGLVHARREGKRVFYSAAGARLAQLQKALEPMLAPRPRGRRR